MSPKDNKGAYETPGVFTGKADVECHGKIFCGYCSIGFKCDSTYDPDTGVAATSGAPAGELMGKGSCENAFDCPKGFEPIVCESAFASGAAVKTSCPSGTTYCERQYCPPGLTFSEKK